MYKEDYWKSDRGKSVRKKYLQSNKGKATLQKYYQSEKYKQMLKRIRESNEYKVYKKEYNKKYRNSDKGKISKIKTKNIRRRNLGFELLFDNPFGSIPIDYHHISDGFVVAVPTFIHRQYFGEKHREKIKPVVEVLYNFTYEVFDDL